MDLDYRILYRSGLFGGITETEIAAMFDCLHAREEHYRKGEFIYYEGDVIQEAGILMSGTAHVMQDDFWGNRNIIYVMKAGDVFGEVYACLGNEKLQTSVSAESDCHVLFINLQKAMHVCKNTCIFHQRLIENLVYSVAKKNLNLTAKMQHTSRRSIREKVLSYLSEESRRNANSTFVIPFTRQQMADFLAVDRSALSKELAKMKQEGLIEYEKNRFRLITRQ
ncbi:MAG: Crp/Fnr family transcriptional regulator [Lachnospiraceae bacterium]|nr:Crp/Fnr family transcriptional regulator [Lachnospiraceae bacterium]